MEVRDWASKEGGEVIAQTMPPQVASDPIYSRFWREIRHYDNNILLLVCGATGTCKSGSSVTIANDVDRDIHNNPRFIIEDDGQGNPTDKCRVIHTPQGFLRLINSGLPKGSAIIWDEIGIEQDSRDFWTLKNKFVKRTMQLFRSQNLILIMTVPDLKSVDIGIRRLQQYYLEMYGATSSKEWAVGNMDWVQVAPKTGKTYYKDPRFKIRTDMHNVTSPLLRKSMVRLGTYYIKKPPAYLEEPYKRIKEMMNEKWINTYDAQIRFMQEQLKDEEQNARNRFVPMKELIAKVLENPKECYDDIKKKFSNALIQNYFDEKDIDIGDSKVSRLANVLNVKLRKGAITV